MRSSADVLKKADCISQTGSGYKDHNVQTKINSLQTEQVIIETEIISLRAAIESDADVLYGAFSGAEVMRYWSETAHISPERTAEWIANTKAGSHNGVTDFIICLKPEMTPIGKIGIWQDREIGFYSPDNSGVETWHKSPSRLCYHTSSPVKTMRRKATKRSLLTSTQGTCEVFVS